MSDTLSSRQLSSQKRFFSICLLLVFLLQQTNALASQVTSADLLNELDQSTPFFSAQQRHSLQQQLIKKMRDAGVANEDLGQRVAALSDQDLRLLQNSFDQEAAGGDILGTAVFIFLVLLVTDILGFTDIFPFVNHPHKRHPHDRSTGHKNSWSAQD